MNNDCLLIAPRDNQITIRLPDRVVDALHLLQAERQLKSRTDIILFYLLKGLGQDWDFSCPTQKG